MKTPFFSCLLFITSPFAQKLQICLSFMLLFQISSFSRVSGQCLNDQRSLLLELNSTLTYNSSLSTKLMQWNQNIDCCNWNGVKCDSFGHVIGLELNNETISGGIEKPSALYSFLYLENLNLAENKFNYSQIPRELGNLSSLARLNLSFAEFRGQIPTELSQMTNLVMLDLSGVDYIELKNRLWYPNLKNLVQNLTRLEELYLDSVGFKQKEDLWETLSSLALPNLRSLSLRDCGFSGHMNSSFSQLQTLSNLFLDRNHLSGTSLDFFTNFRNLTDLSLPDCKLQGDFPEIIFQVPTLQHLDLTNNYELTGTIPEFLPGGSIRTLILAGTNFSGSLVDSIINLSNLSMIDISYCNFNGRIPSTLGNLTNLVSLTFENNFFTCSLPIFSMSNKIEHINLKDNNLNGSLSSPHFEGLSNLKELDLSSNSLTGNIPTSLFSLPSLQRLELSDNKFSGQVNEFSTLKYNLVYLNLANNQLEGFIPKSFFRLEKLVILDLSSNFFNGTIHLEDFKTFQNLDYLNLSNNHLSVNMDRVDSKFFSLPQLTVFILDSCNLLVTDGVDSDFSSFPQLYVLHLSSCNLSRFPNLRNLTNLYYLDLSNNKISGDIPSWIWEVGNGSLYDLNLSHNLLTNLQTPYQIPSSLVLLDLYSNMLNGELPLFGGSLKYVDYSNNHFKGHIPVLNFKIK